MRVSILLPTFNGAAYLAEQIRSILDQSFADFELLVYDDGSSDDTIEILQSFCMRDQRIRLQIGHKNQGQSRSLLLLLQQAQGSLVAFADQDDVWEKNKLDVLLALLDSSGRGLAFGPSHLIDNQGQAKGITLHDLAQLEVRPDDALRLIFFPLVSAHAMVVRKQLISPAAFASPILFDWLISMDAQFSGGLAYASDAITYHRIHATNQANGDLGGSLQPPRFAGGVSFPRLILDSGLDDRIYFFERVRYLAYSSIVPRTLQLTFRLVADMCQRAWFSSSPRRIRSRARCEALLLQTLLPLASNHGDRLQAQQSIMALCSNFRRRRYADIIR